MDKLTTYADYEAECKRVQKIIDGSTRRNAGQWITYLHRLWKEMQEYRKKQGASEMSIEEAKRELRQIYGYYNRLRDRKERLAEVRERLFSVRVSTYGNIARPATSQDKYHLEALLDRMNALEAEISDGIIAMYEAQQRIVKKIEMLDEPYATVLTRRYVHMETFEKIAVMMNYTYGYVKQLLGRGIRKYAEL